MTAHPTRPETGHSDSDVRRGEDMRRDDRTADLGSDELRSDDVRTGDARTDERGHGASADAREGVRSWSDGDTRTDADDARAHDARTHDARTDDALTDDARQGGMRSTGDIDTSYRSGAGAATAGSGAGATAGTTTGSSGLLGDDHDLTGRWDQVQATFVDDPRRAVADAAGLVEDTLERLSDTFAKERARGEGAGDDEAGTEDLRLAMQRYREFFRRLLAA